MKLIEKIKSSKFFAKMTSGDVFTKSMLLLLVIGVWAVFFENIHNHKYARSVYVVNTVDANIENTVSVSGEVDVDVTRWNGHRVGSHKSYVDDYGYQHCAIDVYTY